MTTFVIFQSSNEQPNSQCNDSSVHIFLEVSQCKVHFTNASPTLNGHWKGRRKICLVQLIRCQQSRVNSCGYHGQKTLLSLEAFDGWVWNKSLVVDAAAHHLRLLVLHKAAAAGSPDKDQGESIDWMEQDHL